MNEHTPSYWARCPATSARLACVLLLLALSPLQAADIGSEKALPGHLADGQEYEWPLRRVLTHGERLFSASWTVQDGAGRPLSKGTGAPLADPSAPLIFPRNFNRVSAPDSNACAGCHNKPRAGGGGDIVTNVFVLGQRFDFATFDLADPVANRGALDERGQATTLQSIANERSTLGMFGSGYVEMLAREMTADLQAIRDAITPGGSAALTTKGVDFGSLSRRPDGRWDTRQVKGLPGASLVPDDSADPPSLVIRPFHQAGRVVSLREFTNNAFNHHHGMQTSERFGDGTDPDGDGFADELTRGDVTAVTLFQATLPVPGRVIPRDPRIARAVRRGQAAFETIGCTDCHRPTLSLTTASRSFSEPNPYNPPGNLQAGEAPELLVDLADPRLPPPRLRPNRDGTVDVPAYTDLKLHDMCDSDDDPNREPLDMQAGPGSAAFFAGNCHFLTRKLWGVASEPPYFHHGKFTTLREAVLAHRGEGTPSREAFEALPPGDRDEVIEFLKSLQILPPGTRSRVVDERGRPWR